MSGSRVGWRQMKLLSNLSCSFRWDMQSIILVGFLALAVISPSEPNKDDLEDGRDTDGSQMHNTS